MKIVEVERLIHKGQPNPNTGKPYFNMETKLQEFFDYNASQFCEVPISIRNEEDTYIPEMRAEDVVGFAIEFSDTNMTIKIYNEELFDKFEDPRVEICTIINPDMSHDETYIEKVYKIVLAEKSRE